MDYKFITDITSDQYKLIRSGIISICEDGLLRDQDGYIAIAIGSYYSKKIGDRFIITFDNGKQAKFIVCDEKADKDTINGSNQKFDKSMIEFIIDVNLAKSGKYSDAIVSGNFNSCEEFNGNIIRVEKIIES